MKHVLSDMQNSPAAWPFAKPVNKDEVADYYVVVAEPMGESELSLLSSLARPIFVPSRPCLNPAELLSLFASLQLPCRPLDDGTQARLESLPDLGRLPLRRRLDLQELSTVQPRVEYLRQEREQVGEVHEGER